MPVALEETIGFEAIQSGVEVRLGKEAACLFCKTQPSPDFEPGEILAAQRPDDGSIYLRLGRREVVHPGLVH